MNWMNRIGSGLSFVLAAFVATGVFARSITDTDFVTANGVTTVNVTFEAGEPSDLHALYVAYAQTDCGTDIADWSMFQRVRIVAADETAASFTLLPQFVNAGNSIFRVFLVESVYPFDTLIEGIRQTGTQYIDTGVNAGSNTFVSLDFNFSSTQPTQQRIFGVGSDDGSSLFTFDTYINGGGGWASACRDGSGDWSATPWMASTVRLTISLDAATGIHALSNHVTHATTSITHTDSRTATALGAITLFARRSFVSGTPKVHLIANGGVIYGGIISNENMLVCNYLPCKLNGRAGLYDTVSESIIWSAVANDDFLAEATELPCEPKAGETQVAVSDPIDLNDVTVGSVWKGSVNSNWNNFDANWTVNGLANQLWTDGGDAIFNDKANTRNVSIPNGSTVNPATTTFNHAQDYTLTGGGAIVGTGSIVKTGDGTLTITGINHSFTGDVLLAGGTTVLTGNNDNLNITTSALGNPRAAHTITVSNATLRITGQNPIGGSGRSSTPLQVVLKLYNSTLDLPTNFAFNVGDVYVHDSTVNFTHGHYGATHWGSMFAENLYFSGTTPITFAPVAGGPYSSKGNIGLLLGKFSQATIDVPDITHSTSTDVLIRMPLFKADGNGADWGIPSGFRKTGAGTLEFNGYDSEVGCQFSDYTGNVDVVEGTLRFSQGAAYFNANHTSPFGSTGKPHIFTVHPGATLNLGSSDLQGQFYCTNAITIRVNGGNLTQDNGQVNGLGHLILENATLSYQGIRTQNNYYLVSADGTETNHYPVIWPTIGFNGGVEFLGTNVYTLPDGNKDGVHSRLFFGTCDDKPSECYVAEISSKGTADENADVIINARLEDAPPWCTYREVDGKRYITGYNLGLKPLPLNMLKTGPGTLQLNSRLSTTTGRIEMVEGTLRLGGGMGSSEANFECPTNTMLGDLRDPNRVALVLNAGTTLWLTSNDTFGQANAVNHSLIAVTNGTIRSSPNTCNALPALDLYDATLEYSGANTGGANHENSPAAPWGTFIFAERIHFDGTRPYDIQNISGTSYFSLGWQCDSYQMPSAFNTSGGFIDQHGKTEFCVEDITGNASPDVTIGVILKSPCHWNGNSGAGNMLYAKTYFRTGLLKTGPGTLRLNCANDGGKYYTEATRVNGGALLVDSMVFRSTNIIVQAGAYLGGTGTVVRATIEAGAGFTAAPDQTSALTLNAVQLPVGGEVALDIPFVGEEEEMNGYRVPVVKVAGLESAKWNVTVNGEPAPNGFVANAIIQNGVVYGTLSRGGTFFMIR